MSVAYLVNQYPHVSHTFIRREIAALEASGLPVARFSIRRPPANLVDPADIAEKQRTQVVLEAGFVSLLAALLRMVPIRPRPFWRALRTTCRLGWRSDRGVLRHLIYLVEACWLTRALARLGTTHLHAHFGTNSAAVALLVRLLGGPPYSFTVHGPEEFDRSISLSLTKKIRHAAFVVAVSEYGRSQLFRWCPLEDWSKIHVVHCGLDRDFLRGELTPVPDVPRFVCVGRLCEQKGQLLLLEAAAKLKVEEPRLEIILAGDGPMRMDIETRIRELQLDGIVTITGWVSNQQVRETIVASRALVLPSFAEGLPVVIMEALSLGRPVISTYVAGIPELVHDGDCGRLVPAGSIDGLVRAMREIMLAPLEELTRMGAAGKGAVQEKHNAATEAAKIRGYIGAR